MVVNHALNNGRHAHIGVCPRSPENLPCYTDQGRLTLPLIKILGRRTNLTIRGTVGHSAGNNDNVSILYNSVDIYKDMNEIPGKHRIDLHLTSRCFVNNLHVLQFPGGRIESGVVLYRTCNNTFLLTNARWYCFLELWHGERERPRP